MVDDDLHRIELGDAVSIVDGRIHYLFNNAEKPLGIF